MFNQKSAIRRWFKIKNELYYSKDFVIDTEVLNSRLLNRLQIPSFSSKSEMDNFILNIFYLVEPTSISGGTKGPKNSAIGSKNIVKAKPITVTDSLGRVYSLDGKKYKIFDDNMPTDYADLQSFLFNEQSEFLDTDSYGMYGGIKKKKKFYYENICVDHLLGYLTYSSISPYTCVSNPEKSILRKTEVDYWEFV